MKKMVIGVVGFLMLLLMVVGGHAASVDVGGWNFTADLGDQWQLRDPQCGK